MTCINCKSPRLLNITGKTSDLCYTSFTNGKDGVLVADGYVPYSIGVGGGDYIKIGVCMECGRIQQNFPISDDVITEALKEV